MTKLSYIEGIGEKYEKKLNGAGVLSLQGLRERGATAKGRKELVEKTGISDSLILTWVNHADLFRITGIGKQYADLLEAAGVDTVPELAQRKADNLNQKLIEVNKAKKLVKKLPTKTQVENWIGQAKKLPKLVVY